MGIMVPALLLGATPLWAVNSGGMDYTIFVPTPTPNSYVGTKDNITPLTTGADVFVDQDVAGVVVGGYSGEGAPNNADVIGNKVTIGTRGGINTFTIGSVHGGYSSTSSTDDRPSGNANNNQVIIHGGTIDFLTVSGGESTAYSQSSGNANNNTVTIYDGELWEVFGGRVASTSGTAGNANYNTVTVHGGSMDKLVGGRSGTHSGVAGSATYNAVNLYGGTVQQHIYGGYSQASSDGSTGEASYNTVNLYGGTVSRNVYGGYNLAKGSGAAGNSNHNTVNIHGGAITDDVYGGYSQAGGGATAGNADHNTVNIHGGAITGDVYGGYSHARTSQPTGNATYNTVNIYGGTFDSNTFLFGGDGKDNRTGNTLNIHTSGISVGNIGNFQYFNFALSPVHGATLLSLEENPFFSPDDLVKVMQINGGQRLNVGHSNILLYSTAGTAALEDLTAAMIPAGQVRQGVSLLYDYTLAKNANDDTLTATITGVSLNPQSKAFSESRAASLAFANMGADVVAGAGIANARAAASTPTGRGLSGGSDSGMGLVPFFALSGSSMRYNTGSHVDVNGMALVAGLAKQWEAPAADVLLGAFFEAGFGNYRARNSISGVGSVSGNGDSRTLGGGILSRMDMTDTALKGLYAEASLRMGRLKSDYQSGDLRDFAGNSASYDMKSTYYGAHAGLGYIWNFTERASLDLYGKYFWTHQTGQNVRILGDQFSFKKTDSHRTRLGGRFSYAVNESLSPYIGAAWEHEFDGKARATVYDLEVPAPGLQGSSGMGELGISWKPAKATGFSIDAGVQGYAGKRQGVSGNVELRYEF